MDSHEIDLLVNHQEVLDNFITACFADERIVAAILGGSYPSGTADNYSDLDLYFVTTDEAYDVFLARREHFISLLGEPLFLEDFGLPHGYLFILANGTEGEVWFGRESNFQTIHAGPFRVLLDKKECLKGAVFPKRLADPTAQVESFCQQINWFWHELAHFVKAMGRRQLWFARGQIEVMRQICVNLARLRHNFSDAYNGDEPYFKVEQVLPIERLAPLQTTFCPLEYEAMLQAALVLCRYYQDLAPDLARVHDLEYQRDLERMLMSQLNELGQVYFI